MFFFGFTFVKLGFQTQDDLFILSDLLSLLVLLVNTKWAVHFLIDAPLSYTFPARHPRSTAGLRGERLVA